MKYSTINYHKNKRSHNQKQTKNTSPLCPNDNYLSASHTKINSIHTKNQNPMKAIDFTSPFKRKNINLSHRTSVLIAVYKLSTTNIENQKIIRNQYKKILH